MRTPSTKKRILTSDPRRGERNSAPDDRRLFDLLAGFDSLIVAFSGGVDSAYLAWAATRVLGRERTLCITADSPSYPDRHRQLARTVARDFALRHEIIHTRELDRPDYSANPVNRCYYCKHELYTALARIAVERGFGAVADGANADDRGDYRPGRQAAREFGVRSPLDEAGLTKADIRALSHRAGLPTWDEPASACLSSRIPYNSVVTVEKLRMIERAERALRDLGFRVCRVRHHDDLARVEIGVDELPRALEPDLTSRIVAAIQALGYRQVTIDPRGYRMGSLNEGVVLRPA
jgi:pyridinium-3,5-biscarboxylic acid mononucleotide sulfurtransferase